MSIIRPEWKELKHPNSCELSVDSKSRLMAVRPLFPFYITFPMPTFFPPSGFKSLLRHAALYSRIAPSLRRRSQAGHAHVWHQ
jgi:hypothetical protein